MSTPAQRSVQEIAREATDKIVVPTGPADWLVYYGPNGETTALIENRKTATAIILRAIAEAVQATGAREALECLAFYEARRSDPDTAWEKPMMKNARSALAALDELGRAAE